MEYSEHIDQIIEKKPVWLIRYGISSILFVFFTFLLAAWLIEYPDVVKGSIIITTPDPPIDLVTMVNAPITDIFSFKENDTIDKNQPIIVFQSTTSFRQIQELKNFLESVDENQLEYWNFFWADSLGSIQKIYDEFMLSFSNIKYYEDKRVFDKRVNSLSNLIHGQLSELDFSEIQIENKDKDLELQRNEFNRYEKLHKKGIISDSEFEKVYQALLLKKLQLISSQKRLNSEKNTMINLNRDLFEIEQEKSSFEHNLKIDFQRKLYELKNSIEEWESNYVLKSPISGKISFFQECNVGDFFSAGERVLTIIPLQKDKLHAIGQVPISNSGKILVGNKVVIKLESFPFHEYGTIDGKVVRISEIPSEDKYSITISLPQKMKTSSNKEIEFKQRLKGTAEIITQERSVLSRIFNEINKVLKSS